MKSITHSQSVEAANILVEALPYLRKFAGKTPIVIKIGGEILANPEEVANISQDIALLNSLGIRVIVIHGGGPQVSKLMNESGLKPEFINGQRVTDAKTLQIVASGLMEINRNFVKVLLQHTDKTLGLSGESGIIRCKKHTNNIGYVGNVTEINYALLNDLCEIGYIPVIAPLGVDENCLSYNINADAAAANIAISVNAIKMVVISNIEGVYEDFATKNQLISEIDRRSLYELLRSGKFSSGMVPKVEGVLLALENGVPYAHILNGKIPHVILLEFLTRKGIGTLVHQ